MTVYKISLYTAFDEIGLLNTPKNRKRPAADIFKLLGLTPENHALDGEYRSIGEFFDQGGAIERVIKRKRAAHNKDCASCEPVLKAVSSLPEWHDLAKTLPSTPEIPKYEFKLDAKKSDWNLEKSLSPSPLARKRKEKTSPATPTPKGQSDAELIDKMNDHMYKVYNDAKIAQENWSNDVRRTIKKGVGNLYDAVPWSAKKSSEHFPRSQRAFAETILKYQSYGGRRLNDFLRNQRAEEAGLISKIYNNDIHKQIHSAAAADVAEVMLAKRDQYTDEEWLFAKRMFYRHTKHDMEEAAKVGLGRDDNAIEWHRFGVQFHPEDANYSGSPRSPRSPTSPVTPSPRNHLDPPPTPNKNRRGW